MKRNSILIGTLILGFLSSTWAKDAPDTQVVAYYFFTNFRCASCYKIEQYTKEALEQHLSDEIKAGRLVFKPVNIEKKENQHFIEDYQLFSKSVVISMVSGGKEVKYKNLVKVWDYLRDRQKFYDYIKSETRNYLDEASK